MIYIYTYTSRRSGPRPKVKAHPSQSQGTHPRPKVGARGALTYGLDGSYPCSMIVICAVRPVNLGGVL